MATKKAKKKPVKAKKSVKPSQTKAKGKAKAKAKKAVKAKPAAVKKTKTANAKTKTKTKTKTIKPKLARVAPVTSPTKITPQRSDFRILTPLDDRVLIRVAEPMTKTAGGIFIPTTATDQPDRGQVVAKGRGRRNKKGVIRPLDVNVGDTVLFPKYSGTKITFGNEDYLILREEDILGVVTS